MNKLVYRNILYLEMTSDFHLATARLSVSTLDQASLGIIGNVITLLNVRAGPCNLDTLNLDQIDTMIIYLSTD